MREKNHFLYPAFQGDEDPFGEELLDEELLDEELLDEEQLDDELLDEELFDEELLDEDPDEEAPDDEEGEDDLGEEDDLTKGKDHSLFLLLLAGIVFWLILIPCLKSWLFPVKEKPSPPAEEVISVTEAASQDAWPESSPQETLPDETASGEEEKETNTPRADAVPPPDLSWQKTIFGSDPQAVMREPITVKGLTENEKNLISFRESDFIKSLSAFLLSNGLSSTAVTFTSAAPCSSQDAAGYQAVLSGVKEYDLTVLFFPEYPGKYLFTLNKKETQTDAGTKKVKETERSAYQSEAPRVVFSPPQTEKEPESSYDAMSLEISGLNEELSNYLSNPYELQYGLYDYLYRHGIRNAKKASVTNYYIDSTSREATIQIRIEGSGNVTAIYDADDGSYEFR